MHFKEWTHTNDDDCMMLCVTDIDVAVSAFIITSLPKVIWEQGRIAPQLPQGAFITTATNLFLAPADIIQ